NGSLMRLAPVACFASNDIALARSVASAQSRATHASQAANECCQFLAELLCRLTREESFSNILGSESNNKWRAAISNTFPPNLSEISEADVRSGGYVVDTLHVALWSVQNTRTFEEAVLKAVNLGDDADTTGAVTGQIAGACYGYSSIPRSLKSGMISERKLYVTSQLLIPNP
ncbi:MAG: ADP-ribosylglycohydrolase family protein, partial [Sulfitobacter sp.]|nr:ADP-ribosylglycohydrolase family protein [Sulfitobacter sp.]